MKFQNLANLTVEGSCEKDVNPAISVKCSDKADPTLKAQLGRVEDNGHCGHTTGERRDAQREKRRETRRETVKSKKEGKATEGGDVQIERKSRQRGGKERGRRRQCGQGEKALSSVILGFPCLSFGQARVYWPTKLSQPNKSGDVIRSFLFGQQRQTRRRFTLLQSFSECGATTEYR